VLLAAALLAGLAVVAGSPTAQAAPPVGAATVTGGHADWGVRASFRSYVTGPIAQGSVTVSDGVTTNGDGSFRWPGAAGAYDAGAVDAGFDGTVRFVGHAGALDMTVSGLEVVITSATTGTLYADVVSKSFEDGELDTYTDVAFATLDLTGITPSESGSTFTWSAIPATLTADGSAAFSSFYPAGTVLDPVTASLDLQAVPAWQPQITLSKTTGIDPAGETVTVTGTGFDPGANISTRPPVPVGMPTGVYVVFGRFADTWAPSSGAPSSARRVIDQKWPLPGASKAAAEAAFGPNPQYVVLQPDGRFTTTLQMAPNESFTGNYGVATYAAGGAAPNPSQETFTPISFLAPTGTDAGSHVPAFELKGNKDQTKFKVEITNHDTNEFLVSPADVDVTVEVNGIATTDPVVPTSTNTKKIKAGKVGAYSYEWAHGASLQAGDVVEVTACVTVPDDDSPSNNCSTTVSPSTPFDLSTTATLATVSSKKSSVVFKATALNVGGATVLLRPDDVDHQLFVNDAPAGGTVTSRTELGKRKLVKPTKQAGYSFTWEYGSVSVGDVVKVVTCVPVPGDVTPGDNCAEASYVVVK
jgi:hypothetical protein